MGHRQKPVLLSLSITEFSKEGHGIGQAFYPEGKISQVEVPFTIPGDKVTVTLTSKRKGLYQARLETMTEPSPERIPPRCIHFGSCGGCRWQQLPYELQLKQKEKWITDLLKPYILPETVVHPIIPADPWHYRNKMELTFSSDKAGNQYLGLILYGTRGHVFNMQECPITTPWMVDAVKVVKEWWRESKLESYHLGRDLGSLRTLTLREGRRTGDRLVFLTVSGNPEFALHKNQLNSFVASLRAAVEPADPAQKFSIFLRIQQIAKGHPTNFYEVQLYGPDHIREVLFLNEIKNSPPKALTFKISPVAFFQPNTDQAEKIYNRALQMVDISSEDIVYDLYCGTGTLGICVAHQAKEVIGIELSPEAVLDARENAQTNGLSNMTILKGDVGYILKDLIQQEKRKPPRLVMIDPPRSGLDARAIQYLLEIKSPKILYISCNPNTQAGNLEGLIAGGYQLESIQPVDQFPQTVHVENIVVLKLKA